MPVTTGTSYYKLKISINSKDGKLDENYNLLTTLNFPTQIINAAQTIITYRGMLLGGGASEVAAVLSLENFLNNRADGIAWPVSKLTGPIRMKTVAAGTETTIEPYGKANVGIRFELPTVQGRVERRLMRFVRSSWIANDQFQGVGVVPMSSATYSALFAAYPTLPTLAQAIGGFMSFVRDNTMLVQRGATQFTFSSFNSGTPDWSIDAIGSRAVGEGWPATLGRRRAFA